MIEGLDISHWNEQTILSGAVDLKGIDFIMIKATEGRTYNDKMLRKYMDILPSTIIKGVYHYARPETNKAINEAQHFIDVIRPYIGRAVLAVDIEGSAFNNANIDQWALDFCTHVYEITGVRPLIYTSESQLKKFKKTAAANFGLWVAKWSDKEPKVSPWKFWAIWQYQGTPIDKDIFNGSREQLLKYALPLK